MRLKTREQEWLAFAALLTGAAALFTAWPQLDLALERPFWVDGAFAGSRWAWSKALYAGWPWVARALVAWHALVLLHAAVGSRRRVAAVRRAAMLLLVFVFGVGLATEAMKDGWGRPRPGQLTAFGGAAAFRPALQPSAACARNCSSVSGHAASAFAVLSLGALGTRRKRWSWWCVGVALGGVMGLVRMSQGGHFASDIVLTLLVVWGVSLALRQFWWSWAARRRRVNGGAVRTPDGAGVRTDR